MRREPATDGRSMVSRGALTGDRTAKPVVAGPINEIFVLAPRPFDPYGGDYAAWLGRLAWPNRTDQAGDRTVFSADGYREADAAPLPDPPATVADAADDLARRSNALSLKSFQALKTNLDGG